MAMDTSTSSNHSSKKNRGKIPKRIHKAEREKMKREHLNELFLALANSLELIEATRLVRDMVAQIEGLRKENATLLTESQYVTVEKHELKNENSALEAEIGKLQSEINSKVTELQLDLNTVPPEYHNLALTVHNSDGPLVFPRQSPEQIVTPVHLSAFCSSTRAYPEVGTEQVTSKHIPIVSKPHARYPTPADKWPSQVLVKQPELGKGNCA